MCVVLDLRRSNVCTIFMYYDTRRKIVRYMAYSLQHGLYMWEEIVPFCPKCAEAI